MARKYAHGYLSAVIICSKMRTDSREAKLKENCELPGTDKFSRKTKALLFIILQMFCNGSEKIFTNSFLFSAWDVSSECPQVRLYKQANIPFFCNSHKTLSLVELNFKRRLIVADVRFEHQENHLDDILGYPP